METRPQILIADDHVIFADGLRLLLEKRYSGCGDCYRRARTRQ